MAGLPVWTAPNNAFRLSDPEFMMIKEFFDGYFPGFTGIGFGQGDHRDPNVQVALAFKHTRTGQWISIWDPQEIRQNFNRARDDVIMGGRFKFTYDDDEADDEPEDEPEAMCVEFDD